jgi:hypothetical protein
MYICVFVCVCVCTDTRVDIGVCMYICEYKPYLVRCPILALVLTVTIPTSICCVSSSLVLSEDSQCCVML